MPAQSPSYWGQNNSQVSISAGGCSSASSTGEARHYIDPWDLENYAYLRRHSVASETNQQPALRHTPRQLTLSSKYRRAHTYARLTDSYDWQRRRVPSSRGPSDDASALVDDLYDCYDVDDMTEPVNVEEIARATARTTAKGIAEVNDVCRCQRHCHHRHCCRLYSHDDLPICYGETVEYSVEPLSIYYVPLAESQRDKPFEKNELMVRRECECTQGYTKEYTVRYVTRHATRNDAVTSVMQYIDASPNERCTAEYCMSGTSNDSQIRHSSSTIEPSEDERTDVYAAEMKTSLLRMPHATDLNTYGHLKIDYTNSWNSLNRKINK